MKSLSVTFVTTNLHKFEEVSDVLKAYPVKLVHLNQSYQENHDASLEEIAKDAAQKLAEKYQKPIVVEDTGLFFEAYPNFPGALPKFVFQTLGYKGIMKLLAGESRAAYFKTVAGFCEPGENPMLFEGIMKGTITEEIFDTDKDVMPYDRIFIPNGYTKTISRMTLAEKNSFSQRAQAFHAFGEYIKKRV